MTALGAEYFPTADTRLVDDWDYGARTCLDGVETHEMLKFEVTDATALSPATAFSTCGFPWPLLTQGSSTLGYMVSPTRGPYDPTSLPAGYPTVSYPSGRPSSALWSEIGIPDDSADGTGSWLVVGTLGQGAWRGELSW